MINLKAIEARVQKANELRRVHPWTWLVEHTSTFEMTIAYNDRTALVAEVEQLQGELKRAEAAVQEDCGHTRWYGNILREDGYTFSANEDGDLVNIHNPVHALRAKLETQVADLRGELEQAVAMKATLVKVLDAFETNILGVAELHGTLRAALAPLEAAADALVPPGCEGGGGGGASRGCANSDT